MTWPIGPCPNISVDSGVARHGKGEETMEEDSKPETLLHPYELGFSDLLLLSSDKPLSSSFDHDEIQRLESITSCIMENLGPNGPGLLAITGVPGASSLRSSLLHFAPQLALLDFRHLNRLLKVYFYITTFFMFVCYNGNLNWLLIFRVFIIFYLLNFVSLNF